MLNKTLTSPSSLQHSEIPNWATEEKSYWPGLLSDTETELAVIFTGDFESSKDGLWPKMMISTPSFFLMMSSYDSVWSISQNKTFFFFFFYPSSL